MANKKHLFILAAFLLLISHFKNFGADQPIIDSLKNVLKKTTQDTARIKLLNDIGGYYIGDRNYEDGLNYLFEAQQLSEKIDYKQGIYISLNRAGIAYLNQNNNSKALAFFSKALLVAKKLKDKKGEADIISNMGIVYSDKGQYAKALENYMAALKIREEIKDRRGTSGSMMSIANIYYLQGKYTTALNFYLNVLKTKDVELNKYFYAEVLNNTGLAFMQLKKYPQALDYFNATLKIDTEISDMQGVAIVYTNIGSIYYIIGDYKKALEVEMKGFTILNELSDKKGISESYGEIGVIYDSLKQPEKALESFKNQLRISNEIGNKLNARKAYLFFSNHFQLAHNYKEAYDYYKLYKSMEDSINNESSTKTIAELEAKYETQTKEKEIELLKTEKQLQIAENNRQKQLIFGCFILAVVISLSIFLLYNRQQIKKKSLLEKKNFELERNALSAQMNPHFIFNSLGSISGFISENDKDKALEYLGIFSRLIRHNLEQSREQLVSVIQEAQMLKSYLFLQQLRYNNKFSFKIELDENMDPSIAIPPMFIQPFIENSILHGIIPKNDTGTIIIKFYVFNDTELICEVHDDGIGKTESLNRKVINSTTHRSLAMTITEERMQIINSMNKEKIQISTNDILAENQVVVGTLVKLVFPMDYI
ncbi:MAG: tetratricopeptide repeat protein [Bacteroidetes bacterium]|nr:tetratricopeptide repeat protein [Bacteroidota bacterium]